MFFSAYRKCCNSSSSHGLLSRCSPMQAFPPPRGEGLLQVRLLDFLPPEQELQEDQQLQCPSTTPTQHLEIFHIKPLCRWFKGTDCSKLVMVQTVPLQRIPDCNDLTFHLSQTCLLHKYNSMESICCQILREHKNSYQLQVITKLESKNF